MRFLILLLITSLIFFACKKSDRFSLDERYYFELDDSLRIDLMIDFGFVTKEAINGYMLVYTYQDGIFYLINKSGKIEYSIDRSGDGPKMYSKNLRFATIFDRRFLIMDNRNLHFYEFNGNWIKSIPYPKENGMSAGIPSSDFYFLDSNRFITANQEITYLPQKPYSYDMLDTLPVWIEYKYSDISSQFEKSNRGLMDSTGIWYSKLKYSNYESTLWLQDGFIWQVPIISSTLYQYGINESLYPLDKRNLNISNFKAPIGLNADAMTIENFEAFNKTSTINSSFGYVVPMDNGNFFAIYSTGVSEHNYDRLSKDGVIPESEYYGYYFDRTEAKGYSIALPNHVGHPSFWKKISYLGEYKFLFVFENEVERDYYWGKVFELKPISK